MIIDPRFESFLYGRATSEQIRLLRSMGMSKKDISNHFSTGEKRIKQCERTPGDFIYIMPRVWMAVPVLHLPKHVHFCIRNYYRKRMKIYNIIDVVHIYGEIYRTRERTGHINLNHVFGRSSGIKWWLSGRICSYDDVLKYEKSNELIVEMQRTDGALRYLNLPKDLQNKKEILADFGRINYHNKLEYKIQKAIEKQELLEKREERRLQNSKNKKEVRKHRARLAD